MDQNHFKYDERLRTGEDYDMWVKLSDKGNIGVIKKVLFNFFHLISFFLIKIWRVSQKLNRLIKLETKSKSKERKDTNTMTTDPSKTLSIVKSKGVL